MFRFFKTVTLCSDYCLSHSCIPWNVCLVLKEFPEMLRLVGPFVFTLRSISSQTISIGFWSGIQEPGLQLFVSMSAVKCNPGIIASSVCQLMHAHTYLWTVGGSQCILRTHTHRSMQTQDGKPLADQWIQTQEFQNLMGPGVSQTNKVWHGSTSAYKMLLDGLKHNCIMLFLVPDVTHISQWFVSDWEIS